MSDTQTDMITWKRGQLATMLYQAREIISLVIRAGKEEFYVDDSFQSVYNDTERRRLVQFLVDFDALREDLSGD